MPSAAAFFALGACCLFVYAPPQRAHADDTASPRNHDYPEAALEQQEERRNAIVLGFAHAFQIVRPGEREPGAADREHLWGFTLAYERVLIPRRLALVIAKPFYFTRDRFDSPLDVLLKVVFPKDQWEPFVGAGVNGNLRVFKGELEQAEGRRLEYTFGVGAIAGFTYAFTPRWGLSVEVGYSYFVNGLIQHEVADALSGVWFF